MQEVNREVAFASSHIVQYLLSTAIAVIETSCKPVAVGRIEVSAWLPLTTGNKFQSTILKGD